MSTGGVGGPTLRLFVAVLLPETWRLHLRQVQEKLEQASPRYARWVPPELMHLTLVFLGYQPGARLPPVLEACQAAAAASNPFELSLRELGAFGPPSRPRVLWASVGDLAGELPRLHQALTRALESHAVAFDPQPLAPHVTLGRARQDTQPATGRSMRAALREPVADPLDPGPFRVERVSLMRSQLARDGPRYTEQERYSLGTA